MFTQTKRPLPRNRRRFQGTIRRLYAEWPTFTGLYGTVILTLLIIGFSINQRSPGVLLLALAALLLAAYFLLARLWATYYLFDANGLAPHHRLFDLGQISENNRFLYVDLGQRWAAIELARRLITGKIIIVDVYSPQWTPNPILGRQMQQAPHPPSDPRLIWLTGTVSLLPMPDESVPVVILNQVLSEFWQRGDQLALLHEVRRVLAKNGRLLVAERCRTQINGLVLGPAAVSLPHQEEWQLLLQEAGFQINKQQDLMGLIHCFRAYKPTPSEAQQLALGLEFL